MEQQKHVSRIVPEQEQDQNTNILHATVSTHTRTTNGISADGIHFH